MRQRNKPRRQSRNNGAIKSQNIETRNTPCPRDIEKVTGKSELIDECCVKSDKTASGSRVIKEAAERPGCSENARKLRVGDERKVRVGNERPRSIKEAAEGSEVNREVPEDVENNNKSDNNTECRRRGDPGDNYTGDCESGVSRGENASDVKSKWHRGVCKWFNGIKGWGFINIKAGRNILQKDIAIFNYAAKRGKNCKVKNIIKP